MTDLTFNSSEQPKMSAFNQRFSKLNELYQYWWSVLHGEASSYYEEVKTKITIGKTIIGRSASIQYAKSISIDSSGGISLVSPTTLNCSHYESGVETFCSTLASLAPVYISALGDEDSPTIYFIPTGATYTTSSWGSDEPYTIAGRYNGSTGVKYVTLASGAAESIRASVVTSQVVNVPAGETTYVHSYDRNAYPDSGTVAGLTYQFLGIPFDNAVEATKIATGSYVGTGVYGASNPNSLTFDFQPKVMLIPYYMENNASYLGYHSLAAETHIWILNLEDLTTEYENYNGFGVQGSSSTSGIPKGKKSQDGKTIYWYSGWNAQNQFNSSGYTYHYIALG